MRWSLATTLVCLTLSASAAEPGLSVRQGQLLLRGKPYRGMGVNYFSLFYRTLKNPADTSYRLELAKLSKANIPFVRFMACGFWPVDWDLYQHNKKAYFARLDDVIAAAEKNRIGLIPSLFWNMATVPDIVGEPMDQWGNADSRTIAFMRNYTRELVTRYKDSPAIWGWEFGNEYNLHIDLPNAAPHRPPVWPTLKTAPQRSQRDDLTSRAMLTAYADFARTVRLYDKHRILITGNSIPRRSAYHNSLDRSWKPDSPEQFRKVLLRDNPSPYDTICVHLYPSAGGEYPRSARNLAELIRMVQDDSVKAKKPLFIGEFGIRRSDSPEKDRQAFSALLHSVEAAKVPLSAIWVFDHAGQNKDWNVTFENNRKYMLALVGEVNQRTKDQPETTTSPSSHKP